MQKLPETKGTRILKVPGYGYPDPKRDLDMRYCPRPKKGPGYWYRSKEPGC